MTNQVQQLVYEVFKSTHAFMLRMRDIGGAGEESLTDMLLPVTIQRMPMQLLSMLRTEHG